MAGNSPQSRSGGIQSRFRTRAGWMHFPGSPCVASASVFLCAESKVKTNSKKTEICLLRSACERAPIDADRFVL